MGQEQSRLVKGPVLEIGSRHYAADTSVDYRGLHPNLDYVGVDMSEGANVDIVLDFTIDGEIIREKLGGRAFKTVICCSVLEHVDDVFTMARNISSLTEPDGTLFVSVPFTWRVHGYPNDYWRFTPAGLRRLFPEFRFLDDLATISSNAPGDMDALTEDPNPFVVRPSQALAPRYRLLSRVKFLERRLRAASALDRDSYVLLPSNINMVAVKVAA